MKAFQCNICKCTVYGYKNLICHRNKHRQNKIENSREEDPAQLLFKEIQEAEWDIKPGHVDLADVILDNIQNESREEDPAYVLFKEIQETEWVKSGEVNLADVILDQTKKKRVAEQQLYNEIDEMVWEQPTDNNVDDILEGNSVTLEFGDINDGSFHADSSLVENMDVQPIQNMLEYADIRDQTFHAGDSRLQRVGDSSLIQYGAGQNDYDIAVVKEKELKKMNAKDVNYELTFRKNMFERKRRLKDVLGIVKHSFQDMIDRVKQNLRPGDLMRGAIYNDALDVPIFIPSRPMEEMDADTMLDAVVNVLNSEESLPFDSSCRVAIGAIQYPRGGHSTKITNIQADLSRKKSIVPIHNSDNDCLLRSTAVAYASKCKQTDKEIQKFLAKYGYLSEEELLLRHGKCSLAYYRGLRENRKGRQDRIAYFMAYEMNITTGEPLTYEILPRLEEYLNVNIYVVASFLGNGFSYVSSGSDTERRKLFLYHVKGEDDKDHFHAIVKIAGFFAQSYFCTTCLKPYSRAQNHSCLTHCNVCLSDQCVKQQEKTCPDCNRVCRSLMCYLRHKKISDKGTMPCQFFYKCPSCYKTFETHKLLPKNHKCGYYTCYSCQQYVDPTHLCYARSAPGGTVADRKYIFADIEASQRDCNVQCEWGFSLPEKDECTDCRYERIWCLRCLTCRNCLRSECGKSKSSQCSQKYSPAPVDQCQECTFERKRCKACKTCQNCLKASCGQKQHTFVLAVCQTACSNCEQTELTPGSTCEHCGSRCAKCSKRDPKTKALGAPCKSTCGYRERTFRTLHELGSWIFHDNHKGYTVMFHNLSYDGQFLMQYLLSQSMRPSFVIYRGSKIQMFNVHSLQIRVIDSFNFLPMALAKLPKAFQLDTLVKGYFPHFFTCREHLNYVGPYPPVQYYGPDSMSLDNRSKFLDWYQNKVTSGEVFDFQKEMIKYCQSDVDILRRACLKFKNLLLDATGSDGGMKIDAFASCTIASLCMEVFKKKFLREEWKVLVGTPISDEEARNNVSQSPDDKEAWLDAVKLNGQMKVFHDEQWKNTVIFERQTGLKIKESVFVRSPIARPPPNGYVTQVKFSKKSIQWLEWLMHRASVKGETLNIQHALNGRGEYKVPGTNYLLDGFVAPDAAHPQAIAFEFNGCLYHGCPKCFKRGEDVLNPRNGCSATELLSLTRMKETTLRDLGFKVVSIWECQFDSQMKKNDTLREYVAMLDIESRLNPRDSLMGGRTNGSVLFKRANTGTKIKYVDFTSLYPFINKNAKYPLYHPEIITGNVTDITSYFGIAKVKVLPPRGLFHPVLGYKTGGKLTFPLCRTCVEKQQQTPCRCPEADRSFVGTFCTPEIEKAIEKGYKILKIYEIYHWPETTQYDPTTKTGGLFVEYINMFLKIKQEASGRPEWVKTEADLEKYIELYEEREGIRLDPQNVELNLGLRSLAKLLLNNFWGKFGQRMNLTRTQFIHDSEAHKLFRQMVDPTIEIVDFNIVNDETLMLSTKKTSEDVCDPGHTNVFLAAFTTCWARLRLYELLDMLQTRALYWDTDSVIYLSVPGEPDPPTGDYLGELTDELGGSDTWIESLIVCGPKNYAYKTNKGTEVCKVKGFSLNYGNSQILNYESMQDAMFNREDPLSGLYALTNPSKICRQKISSEIYSQEEIKQYACVYTKRVVLANLTTIPYGY